MVVIDNNPLHKFDNCSTLIQHSIAPEEAMDDDLQLFETHSSYNRTILRLYKWNSPTISLGKLQNKELLDLRSIDQNNIAIVKRPTGGRHIFHNEDISFSFVIPRSLFDIWGKTATEQQYTIGTFFLQALELLNISAELSNESPTRKSLQNQSKSNCFSTSIPSEICVNGKKLVGIAHLITDKGALIQGTIPLSDAYLDIVRYEKGSTSDKEKRLSLLKEKSCSLQSVSRESLPSFEKIADLWKNEFIKYTTTMS